MGLAGPIPHPEDHYRHRRPEDWRLFEEWLLVAKGRRTLEWSRGLRVRLLPDERERSDEELAAASQPGEEVAAVSAEVWLAVVAGGLLVPVLTAVEERGLGGLVVMLRAAGLTAKVERRGVGPPYLCLSHEQHLGF